MGQTEVLVCVLPTEHLEQIPHVPGGPEHVVVHLVLSCLSWFPVHHNLLDDEAHVGEATRLQGVSPHSVLVDLVDPINQADEVVDRSLGVGTAHLLVEPVVCHQQERAAGLSQGSLSRRGIEGLRRPFGSCITIIFIIIPHVYSSIFFHIITSFGWNEIVLVRLIP